MAGGCPAAVPAASWPPLAGALVGGRQLPAHSSRHPRYLPGPPAKREEAESPWGRARNFAASGRARAGVRGSSCRRPEHGEFLSPPALRRRGGRLPGRAAAGGYRAEGETKGEVWSVRALSCRPAAKNNGNGRGALRFAEPCPRGLGDTKERNPGHGGRKRFTREKSLERNAPRAPIYITQSSRRPVTHHRPLCRHFALAQRSEWDEEPRSPERAEARRGKGTGPRSPSRERTEPNQYLKSTFV